MSWQFGDIIYGELQIIYLNRLGPWSSIVSAERQAKRYNDNTLLMSNDWILSSSSFSKEKHQKSMLLGLFSQSLLLNSVPGPSLAEVFSFLSSSAACWSESHQSFCLHFSLVCFCHYHVLVSTLLVLFCLDKIQDSNPNTWLSQPHPVQPAGQPPQPFLLLHFPLPLSSHSHCCCSNSTSS